MTFDELETKVNTLEAAIIKLEKQIKEVQNDRQRSFN